MVRDRILTKFALALLFMVSGSVFGAGTSSYKLGGSLYEPGLWTLSFGYDYTSDLAQEVKPREASHRFNLSAGYQWDERWNSGASLDVRANTVGGQVYKDSHESYFDAIGWTPSVFTSFGDRLFSTHSWLIGTRYLLPLDNLSRREGYKGVVSLGGGATFNLWKGRWSLSQKMSIGNVLNSYYFRSSGKVNPDYFLTYGWGNSFAVWRSLSLDLSFALKATRYLDSSILYNYNNSVSLSYAYKSAQIYLGYENGGFTEDGTVDLWFVDQYRRLVSGGISAKF